MPVAVVAVASNAVGEACVAIVAGSHAIPVSVPAAGVPVACEVSVAVGDIKFVVVPSSVTLPAPPVVRLFIPDIVGVIVASA